MRLPGSGRGTFLLFQMIDEPGASSSPGLSGRERFHNPASFGGRSRVLFLGRRFYAGLSMLLGWKLRTRGLRRHWGYIPVLEPEHLIIAKGFDKFSIRNERQRDCICPRLYESLRVVDCNNKVHVTHTGPLKSFDNVKRVAVWIGHVGAEPAAIAESCTFDNERVGFPSADRITQPSRVHFACFRQRAAVRKDLTEHHPYERFMEYRRECRRLKDLERAAC